MADNENGIDPNNLGMQQPQMENQGENLDSTTLLYDQLSAKITFDDIKKHLSGPVISILLHIVIIVIACTAVVSEAPKPPKDEVVVEVQEMKPVPPPPPPPPEVTQPTEVTDVDVTDFADVPMDAPAVSMDSPAPTVADVQTTSTVVNTTISAPTVSTAPNNSALKLSGLYAARSGGGRKSALKTYGGGNDTERAVSKALQWLKKVQNEDGSWGDLKCSACAYIYPGRDIPEYCPECAKDGWRCYMEDAFDQKKQLTCLALLAFLAHGETPQSEEYGETVLKGIQKVLEWSDLRRIDFDGFTRMTIVVSEAYAVTKIPILEEAMNAMVSRLIRGILKPEGVFSSRASSDGKSWGSNLVNASRAYNAIYSAFNAGCKVEGIDEAVALCIKGMRDYHVAMDGGFFNIYRTYTDDKTGQLIFPKRSAKGEFDATCAGTLFLAFMSPEKEPAAESGMQWLKDYKINGEKGTELTMDWDRLPSQFSSFSWYYMTQALFQASRGTGPEWQKWNKSMKRALITEQDPAGFWLPPADKHKQFKTVATQLSSGKTKEHRIENVYQESVYGGFTDLNGKVWSTTYFTLSLEVYYRYLPTFKPKGSSDVAKVISENDNAGKKTKSAEDSEDDLTL